jgi:hypothetical protein
MTRLAFAAKWGFRTANGLDSAALAACIIPPSASAPIPIADLSNIILRFNIVNTFVNQ